MWNVCARFRLIVVGVGVLSAGTVVEASVLSLKAVKKNDVAIPGAPVASLSVLPNDKIEAEIYLSGWLNDFPPPAPGIPPGVKNFQVKIEGQTFINTNNGAVLPFGWCAPFGTLNCADGCPAAYPICTPQIGCTCAGFNPILGASINRTRPDFLLAGIDGFFPIDTNSINYKYAGIPSDTVGVVDIGVPKYLGTIILRVLPNACGTFAISFVNDQVATVITDANPAPNQAFPTPQPLTLTVSDCAQQLLSCDAPHCTVDARIAHDRDNQGIKFNMNSFVATFSKPTAGMTAADFEAKLIPTLPGDVLPSVSLVTPNGNTATILLSRRIQQTRWTCVRHKASDKRCCFGSLPGDANSSNTTTSDEPGEIYDNLSGRVTPVLALDHCDTDRSTLCSPADMLMVVDLLNGAGAFDPVLGNVLPGISASTINDPRDSCPSMLMPP